MPRREPAPCQKVGVAPMHLRRTTGGQFDNQAREIVHGIGGDLEIKSKVGVGTIVTLSLPITARNARVEAS